MSKPEIILVKRLKNNKIVLGVLFFILYVAAYMYLRIYLYPPAINTLSYKNNNFYVFGLNIPAHLDFCGEKIPSNDMGIKQNLEKEFFNNSYWKAHSNILFNRTQRWFPIIEPILKEEGVPDDFKYLAVIESHLSNVTSPAGAAGFWQLVPSSAYGYGLEVSSSIDERFNVEKATRAACAHIKDAYAVFKNWTLSAAAYNRGIGGIQNALKAQNTDNYYDLLLNSETGSFVYRLLAFKTLLASPSHFGIKKSLHKSKNKIAFKTFKVDSNVSSLHHFAKHIGTTTQVIKQFNPWILGNEILNPAKKKYQIKVPKNNKADYSGYIADLTHELISFESETTVTQTPINHADTVKALPEKVVYYVVKVDEPLTNLAAFFKTNVEDIKKWNNLGDNTHAVKGQTLTIYYNKK